MGLSEPRIFFGVHSIAPYSRTTGEFFGIAKVLASSTLGFTGELIKLNGGSNKWPFAIEDGLLTAEIALGFKEYPNFVFELFLGKAPTTSAAEASGSVSTLTDVKGTSVGNATTGIASITITTAADAKFAKYILKAASATTVDVFASTDLDFARGVDEAYEDDTLKIVAAAVTVTDSGGTTTIDDFGLTITGGSGTVALVTDDTAEFFVKPINTESTEVTIGATTDFRPEFGLISYAAKRADDSMVEFDLFRCKGIGLPIGLEENAFSEAEVTVEAFYDSVRNAVFKMRHVVASV